MKNFFLKIKNSEAAIAIIAVVCAVLVIGGIIVAVVAVNVAGNESTESNAEAQAISIDMNFNTSETESVNSAAQSEVNKASSTLTSSVSNGTAGNTVNKPQTEASSATTSNTKRPSVGVKKPAGTMAKVKPNDAKGLAARNKARAQYLSDKFCFDFYDKYSQRLLIQYPYKNSPNLATAWEYGALQSMQTVITCMNKTKTQLTRLADINTGMEYYGYQKDGKLWGYVVNRGACELGATEAGLAYDDNMWIAINFLRSYELTGKKFYLNRAEYIMKFLIDEAWFEPLGGFFWDTRHEARHSCSNNPTIKIFVDLYKHTGKKTYLTWAQKVYDFSYSTLKDKSRNIYEDLVGASFVNGEWVEGSSAGTGFYSYNTGTMISGAAALYGATKDKKYLDEALSCAEGAMKYFGDTGVKAGYTNFACTSNIWFNAILLRGYMDLYPYAKTQTAKYIEEFQKSMDYAYETFDADSKGYMPYNWLQGWDSSDRSYYREALDMSANAEMYGMLAIWQKQRSN